MNSPVLNSYSVQNASGIIVYIEGDPEFPIQEVRKSAEVIQQKAGENADETTTIVILKKRLLIIIWYIIWFFFYSFSP